MKHWIQFQLEPTISEPRLKFKPRLKLFTFGHWIQNYCVLNLGIKQMEFIGNWDQVIEKHDYPHKSLHECELLVDKEGQIFATLLHGTTGDLVAHLVHYCMVQFWWPGSPSSTFTHTSISNTNLFSYSEIQNIFALLNNYDWKHLRFQSYVGFTLVWCANSVNVLNFSILRGIYLSLACHLFKCTNFNLTWGLL